MQTILITAVYHNIIFLFFLMIILLDNLIGGGRKFKQIEVEIPLRYVKSVIHELKQKISKQADPDL